MTDSSKVVEYDEIIAHRDNRWGSTSIGMGEVMEFKGRPVAIPKTEWLDIYRGQRNSEWRLTSGLYRLEKPYDRAIQMAKLREFEHVMTQVPMMEYEMKQGFQMIALAQHYGMCTDYVDFSGSFAVALFFATCTIDRKTKRYRPMNHREISKSPTGSIYMAPMSMVPLDDLEIIGFSSVNRPSLQHGFLVHDHGNDNMEPYTHQMTFRHSIRLSNEMFRFFDKGKALFPEVDSDSISHLANVIMNSKTIYRRFIIEACREMGLDCTEVQLMSRSEGYEFDSSLPKINPRDIAILDMDLRKSDFILRSGTRFSSRLAFCFDV